MQEELHRNPNYGVASLSFAPIVAALVKQLEVSTLSDYGAGKRNLQKGLQKHGLDRIDYYPYDPVFPEYGPPRSAQLVCCIDVLEHIEPELLENVLLDLKKITVEWGFFSIHLGPAAKFLSDGRNAHLIQKPISWWLKRISDHFEVVRLETHDMMGRGIWMVVTPSPEK